jgi:hypothetical protein
MSANDRQVGGAHYGGGAYQHWDYVCDTRMHYLPATASKYVCRWRLKDGKKDLEKSLHYIDKAEERGITGCSAPPMKFFWQLVEENDLTIKDAVAVYYIQEGDWEAARQAIQGLLEAYEANLARQS